MLGDRRRVQNACQRCRKQKIKCSGLRPCQTCRHRGLRCDYGAEDKYILISERELFELRDRMSRGKDPPPNHDQTVPQDNSAGPGPSQSLGHDEGPAVGTHYNQAPALAALHDPLSLSLPSSTDQNPSDPLDDPEHSHVTNPLVPGEPAYVQETSGALRYLGHSSNYAFTQQVVHMLQQNPPPNPSPETLLSSDDGAFKAESHRLLPLATPDVSGLPSKGVALHYLQSVKFRTQPLFYLFDEVDFTACLQQFYRNALGYARANPVWYAHYLVLMAFGKALDPHDQIEAASMVPVPEYLTRALSVLPDMTYLTDHPFEATEVLCCIALFLQSLDHRRAALSYIGVALRMAHLYALHLDLQERVVGYHAVERGRRVWWTVYALNQKLTSNMGLPNFLNDFDVRSPSPAPSDSDEDQTALAIHIKICKLLGLSLSRVYGSSENDRTSFVSTTQTILRGAASIADECIILTCRPALFCLLMLRTGTWRDRPTAAPTTAMMGVIQICIESATQAVHTLGQLKKHNLLDTFLPFDLECAFSAAVVLTMAAHLYIKILSPHSIQSAKEVIGAIAARDNAPAKTRAFEVEQLDKLLTERMRQLLAITDPNVTYDPHSPEIDPQTGHQREPDFENLFFSECDLGNGFAGHQMIGLADALSVEDFDMLGS